MLELIKYVSILKNLLSVLPEPAKRERFRVSWVAFAACFFGCKSSLGSAGWAGLPVVSNVINSEQKRQNLILRPPAGKRSTV